MPDTPRRVAVRLATTADRLFWLLFDLIILSVVFQVVDCRGHQSEGT